MDYEITKKQFINSTHTSNVGEFDSSESMSWNMWYTDNLGQKQAIKFCILHEGDKTTFRVFSYGIGYHKEIHSPKINSILTSQGFKDEEVYALLEELIK